MAPGAYVVARLHPPLPWSPAGAHPVLPAWARLRGMGLPAPCMCLLSAGGRAREGPERDPDPRSRLPTRRQHCDGARARGQRRLGLASGEMEREGDSDGQGEELNWRGDWILGSVWM